MAFVKVASVSDLNDLQGKVVEAGGKQIALIKSGDKFYAMENACKHQGGPLAEGAIQGTTVTCPWHAWQYNLETGESTQPPGMNMETYPVKVEGDDVLVDV